ncbi:MAG: HAMP domain-containing histidine kinase [Muribaculaceae bacterium]|nr:HAMP domain-containing histidine kinase [Muribaculaceae bacterium]
MRRSIFMVLVFALSAFGMQAVAQNSFERVIKSYNSQLSAHQYLPAAKSAVAASALCADAKNYDGAFKMLTNTAKYLGQRHVTPDSLPAVFFTLEKGKFDLYMRLKNNSGATKAIQTMANYAKKANTKDITREMLLSEANYYYSGGQTAKGDNCIGRLVKETASGGDSEAVKKEFIGLIKKGVAADDATLVDHVYKSYMAWTDSLAEMNAESDLAKAKKELTTAQTTIGDKDHTIKVKNGVIGTLITLLVIAVAALVAGGVMYARALARNRKLKLQAEAADEQSDAKSQMIHNMSAVIEPALSKIDSDTPEMDNLRTYIKRLGEYSDADSAKMAVDESAMENVDLEKFCEDAVEKIRPQLKPGVTVNLSGCKGMAHIAPVEVETILLDLLRNAASNTPANGKITITYKKRGAKSHQFVVTDNGPAVTSDKRETLFNPFDLSRQLSEGDILLLPVCAVRAKNINGTLALDPEVTHGASYVLTLHS